VALPQHTAERLCLSGQDSSFSRGHASSILGGAASSLSGLHGKPEAYRLCAAAEPQVTFRLEISPEILAEIVLLLIERSSEDVGKCGFAAGLKETFKPDGAFKIEFTGARTLVDSVVGECAG
jgi:hypothetical protein